MERMERSVCEEEGVTGKADGANHTRCIYVDKGKTHGHRYTRLRRQGGAREEAWL